MKGAAKCDKHFELQNSANQLRLERTLRFRDIPESMPASASIVSNPSGAIHSFESGRATVCPFVPLCLEPLTQKMY